MRGSSSHSRAARARARASWPVEKTTFADEATEDLSDTTTADERLAMMERLALDAWASSGKPWPSYSRKNMPIRIIRADAARSR